MSDSDDREDYTPEENGQRFEDYTQDNSATLPLASSTAAFVSADATVNSNSTTPSIQFDSARYSDAETECMDTGDVVRGGGPPVNNNGNDVQSETNDDVDVVGVDENRDAQQRCHLPPPPRPPSPPRYHLLPPRRPSPPMAVPPPIERSALYNMIRPVVFTTTSIQYDFYTACEELSGGDYFGLVRFIQGNYPEAQ